MRKGRGAREKEEGWGKRRAWREGNERRVNKRRGKMKRERV